MSSARTHFCSRWMCVASYACTYPSTHSSALFAILLNSEPQKKLCLNARKFFHSKDLWNFATTLNLFRNLRTLPHFQYKTRHLLSLSSLWQQLRAGCVLFIRHCDFNVTHLLTYHSLWSEWWWPELTSNGVVFLPLSVFASRCGFLSLCDLHVTLMFASRFLGNEQLLQRRFVFSQFLARVFLGQSADCSCKWLQ